MNYTQLYLSIGIPSFLVILAWVSNRSESTRLSGEINRLSDKIDRNGERLRAEIDRSTDMWRAEMIAFRKEVHADLVMLHERVVKVETKQDR
jgi:hypothetical protein